MPKSVYFVPATAPEKAGQAMISPAEDHLPENIGGSRAEIVLVELKS
jgi:hypothetical protein